MNILVINGPNLNLLGIREIEIYGSENLNKIMKWLELSPLGSIHSFIFSQTNHEGKIIDTIHNQRHWAEGIIINPGAFTHYSYAIRDAISAVKIPTIEVHLSDINNRENFRKISVISEVCIDQVVGLGKNSYLEGLRILLKAID